MATVRLGKRTEGRSPKIKDFVPLADLEDLVFGSWDIFEDNCYEAAANAGVLEKSQLEQAARTALGDQADEGRLRSRVRPPHQRPEREAEGSKMDHAEMLMDDIRQFQESTDAARAVDDLVRIHRSFPPPGGRAPDARRISNAGCRRTIPRSRPARFTPTRR